jgi:hypothetical protein
MCPIIDNLRSLTFAVTALANHLHLFGGICVFLTTRVSNLDHVLKTYIQPIAFTHAPVSKLFKIFDSYLRREGVQSQHIDRILEWFEATAKAGWAPTGRDIRDLVTSAVDLASTHSRELSLADILEAYTAKTGRPEEWDVVTDVQLYSSEDSSRNQTVEPHLDQKLKRAFPYAWSIPDDGRVTLVFTRAFLQSDFSASQRDARLEDTHRFIAALRHNHGKLLVVDWGWPKGLWSLREGRIYYVDDPLAVPLGRGGPAECSFGLRRLVGDDGMNMVSTGKPWRRLM